MVYNFYCKVKKMTELETMVKKSIDDLIKDLHSFVPITENQANIEKLQQVVEELPTRDYVRHKLGSEMADLYSAALTEAIDNAPENEYMNFDLETSRRNKPGKQKVRKLIEALHVVSTYDPQDFALYLRRPKPTLAGRKSPIIHTQNLKASDILIRCKKGKTKLVYKVQIRPGVFKVKAVPQTEKKHLLESIELKKRLDVCLRDLHRKTKRYSMTSLGLDINDMDDNEEDRTGCYHESEDQVRQLLEKRVQKAFENGEKLQINRKELGKTLMRYLRSCIAARYCRKINCEQRYRDTQAKMRKSKMRKSKMGKTKARQKPKLFKHNFKGQMVEFSISSRRAVKRKSTTGKWSYISLLEMPEDLKSHIDRLCPATT